MNILKRVLYFVQLPPPIHGVSKINDFVYNNNRINYGIEKDIIRINYSKTINEINTLSFSKILTHFLLIIKLISKILRFKPTHVYFTLVPTGQGFKKDLVFVLILKIFGVKTIFHLHGKGIEQEALSIRSRFIYEWVFKDSIVIHLSHNLMSREFKNLRLNKTRIFIAENGVKLFNSQVDNKKSENEISILFLSNLSQSKGLFVLLESFLLLKPTKNKKLKLLLVGDIPNINIENRINEYKIKCNNTIEVLGGKYGSEKISILRRADIFIHPTLNDAFPLVLLEAMQAKLPIISTFEGAIPEIIIDRESGLLVRKNDCNELAQKAQLLIDNESLRLKLATKAYIRYTENYTIELFENKMCQIFNLI